MSTMEFLGTYTHNKTKTKTFTKKILRETAKSGSMATLGGVRERTFFDKITKPSQKTSTSAPGPSKSPLGPQKQAPRPQK